MRHIQYFRFEMGDQIRVKGLGKVTVRRAHTPDPQSNSQYLEVENARFPNGVRSIFLDIQYAEDHISQKDPEYTALHLRSD